MSFLSTLAKIGGVVAAPFTGGLSIPIGQAVGGALDGGSVASDVGAVAGGAAKGAQSNRLQEGQLALGYGNLAENAAKDKYLSDLNGANSAFTAGLSSANYQREGQDRSRKAALLSALLGPGGLQDAKITPGNPAIAAKMPQMSGGLRPSAIGNRDQLLALLSEGDPQAPTYNTPSPYQAPTLPTMPQAGAGENILGGVALGSSLLGAVGPLLQKIGQPSKPVQGAPVADPNVFRNITF